MVNEQITPNLVAIKIYMGKYMADRTVINKLTYFQF